MKFKFVYRYSEKDHFAVKSKRKVQRFEATPYSEKDHFAVKSKQVATSALGTIKF